MGSNNPARRRLHLREMSLANSDATETYEGVGAILMNARTALGLDIDRVSNDLRIRRGYIQAIEAGNFDSLPGQAYTQGFVRSYAGYLKLDADEILETLRDETRARREPDELVFPIPVPESRLPGLRVLAISLLVAGTVYVGWSLSNREPGLIERIPLVPEQFLGRKPIENGADTTKPTDTTKPVDTVPAISGPSTVESDVRPQTGQASVAQATPTPPRMEPLAPNLTYTPPAPENTGPVALAALPAQPKLVSPKPVQPGAGQSSGDGAGGTAAPNMTPSPAQPPTATAPVTGNPVTGNPVTGAPVTGVTGPTATGPASTAKGHVYGATEPGRVVFKLTGDSWIRVDEADGNTLFRRFLRAGEVYNAPDRSDLTFSVGNAGAIEVAIDGEAAPALGGNGELRQKLPLDADALKRGIPKSARPGVKKAKKPDAALDAKPDDSGSKPESKPEPKAEAKPETKPESKPEP